jgi:hypothetical protein
MKTNLTIRIPVWLDKILAWPVLQYRKYKFGEPFRRIYLGQGEYTIVDPDVYYRLGNDNYYLVGKGTRLYAAHNVKAGGSVIQVRLHREIMNAPHVLLVDHINGNGLDNRRANLRLATHTQNMHNCRKRKNATSQYVGVWLDKSRTLWNSSITNEGKKIYLGRFKTEIDAARAYDRAAIKYHGDFARLNFSREDYIDEFPLSNSK